jgi:integrase
MARETQGSCTPRLLIDGSRAFDLRFQVNSSRESLVLHERPGCTCGCGGGWNETAARTELGNILALVRVGMWERPKPPEALTEFGDDEDIPLFSAYSDWWLEQKIAGVIGDHPIAENTSKDLRNRIRHLNAFFGPYRVDQIDSKLCLKFKAELLSTAQKQREALEAGVDLRDRNNHPVRPVGLSMVRKIIECLRSILEEAVEDNHLTYNPARGRRMKVKAPKPKRTFLEMDELAYLIDAAGEQDAAMLSSPAPQGAGRSATTVAGLAAKGLRIEQIAAETGLAKSTVSYHLRRMGAEIGRGYVGRRVICGMLGYGGPRVSELIAMRIGDLRIHDPAGPRFRIPDSKTEAGERLVEMSPDLLEITIEHLDRLRRAGMPTGPTDYFVPNLRGGRMTRRRVGQIVGEAAALASERLAEKGISPLPNVTPHTLRRTYISIALLANNFDVKWVMGQVGHADSKMTMDVYAQLEQRVKRSHGKSFDRLVRQAREQVKGLSFDGPEQGKKAEDTPKPKRRIGRPRRR